VVTVQAIFYQNYRRCVSSVEVDKESGTS